MSRWPAARIANVVALAWVAVLGTALLTAAPARVAGSWLAILTASLGIGGFAALLLGTWTWRGESARRIRSGGVVMLFGAAAGLATLGPLLLAAVLLPIPSVRDVQR